MKIMKKAVSFIMSLIFAASLVFSLLPQTAEASSATRCYTILTGNTTVYSDTGLTRQYGAIYDSDELSILEIQKDYIKVSYPTSRGSKTGYVATNKIMLATGGYTYKTTGQITTYKRPGGASYGYASKGDKVIVLGESKGYVQIRYPVSGGYKFGFVTSKDAGKYIYGEDYADISDGTYYFYSAVAGNKALDVSGGKSNDGTNIQLWDANGTDAQKFTVKKQSDGWYKIETAFGKCLDVNKGENKDGANVLQWKWQNSTNQHWKFISAGNGYYYIKSRVGRYLDVSGGASNNGTNVQLWTKNTSNAQKWKLVNVSGGNGNTAADTKLSYGLYKNDSAYISCGFDGYVTTDGRHEGIDICYYNGADVYSLTDGVVTNVVYGKNGKNGLSTIAIYDSSTNKTVVYLHTNPKSMEIGQKISKGEKIGTQGWRGITNSKGSHTHVEVRNGKKRYAEKSLRDYDLVNENPTSYWNSKGYIIK